MKQGDIAEATLFLESAPFTRGKILHVGGGQSAGHGPSLIVTQELLIVSRKKAMRGYRIFARWPAHYLDRLQLFSTPSPMGVKAGIMLEETSLLYEPHRIDITVDESRDAALLALNANGKGFPV